VEAGRRTSWRGATVGLLRSWNAFVSDRRSCAMRVPHRVVGRTRPASTPLQLVRPASPVSTEGIARAGQQVASVALDQANFLQQRNEQTERFTALSKFNEFQMAAQERMVQLQREAPANGLGFTDGMKNEYAKLRQ